MRRCYCTARHMEIISIPAIYGCWVLLVLLPTVACTYEPFSTISVRIDIATNPTMIETEISGSITDVIPDEERGEWRMNDLQMFDAAESYSGARPTNVYVKSPTPWKDLYKTFGWNQVKRTLVPINATILGNKNEQVFITSKTYRNNHDKSSYTLGVSQEVKQTVSSVWSSPKDLFIGKDIEYKINFPCSGVVGESSIAYTAAWGETETKENPVSVGNDVAVRMPLEKGQAVKSSLYATRGITEIMVYYKAILKGNVACNYHRKHKGHYFWAYDVNACLKAVGAQTVVESSQLIRIEHYSQGRLIVEVL